MPTLEDVTPARVDYPVYTGLAGKKDNFAREHFPIWFVAETKSTRERVAFQASSHMNAQQIASEMGAGDQVVPVAAVSADAATKLYDRARTQELWVIEGPEEALAGVDAESYKEYARGFDKDYFPDFVVRRSDWQSRYIAVDAGDPDTATDKVAQGEGTELSARTTLDGREVPFDDTWEAFYDGELVYMRQYNDSLFPADGDIYVTGDESSYAIGMREQFITDADRDNLREKLLGLEPKIADTKRTDADGELQEFVDFYLPGVEDPEDGEVYGGLVTFNLLSYDGEHIDVDGDYWPEGESWVTPPEHVMPLIHSQLGVLADQLRAAMDAAEMDVTPIFYWNRLDSEYELPGA